MKKILSLVLVIIVAFSLFACGGKVENDANVSSAETVVEQESENNTEWKQFLKEYEDWVDEYIEITKKYKSNSADISILSDYTNMLSELTEWSGKVEDIQKDLENASSSELVEYSKEVARIAKKLAEVAY